MVTVRISKFCEEQIGTDEYNSIIVNIFLQDQTGSGCLRAHRLVRDRGSCRGPGGSEEPARSARSG